jgi:Ser/Thr protein kinase RdoA (MazF antagonist)
MEPFYEASHRAQILRLRRLAESALAQYEIDVNSFTTLLHLENTTFRIDAGEEYVLRINRPRHRTKAQIKSETTWLEAIRQDTDLVVPEPIANRSGEMVTVVGTRGVPEERSCVLFKWVEGQFYRNRLSPIALERMGRFTAKLHEHAQHFEPPSDFNRPNVEFGSDDDPGEIMRIINRGLEEGAALIAPHDLATFTLARHHLQDALDEFGSGADVFGLIHADLHHGNCLFHDEEVRAIDFDDCGWGHYLYDLAVTQWYLQARPDFDALCAAHLEGYRAIRPLDDDAAALLPIFRAARTLLMALYMAGRGDNSELRNRAPQFVARCAMVLRDYLTEYR